MIIEALMNSMECRQPMYYVGVKKAKTWLNLGANEHVSFCQKWNQTWQDLLSDVIHQNLKFWCQLDKNYRKCFFFYHFSDGRTGSIFLSISN